MLPSLAHIPRRMITRIPGPSSIGSRRAQAIFGQDPAGNGSGGLPSGQQIQDYWDANNAPVWFAVSDLGAGFIPWGFWEIAMYPTGQMPPNPFPASLSTYYVEIGVSSDKYAVASVLWGIFEQILTTEALTYPIVAQWSAARNAIFGTPPFEAGQVVLTAPFGLDRLQVYYQGPVITERGPLDLAVPGWDNPIFLALWSPGNRAMLFARTPGRSGYPAYPSVPPGPSAEPVALRTASNYEILAKSGVANVPTSHITGHVGLSPAAATGITGLALSVVPPGAHSTSAQVTGNVFAADYIAPTPANLTQAVLDMQAAYTDAAGRTPNHVGLAGGLLNGQTLAPGIYKWTTGVTISGDITLAGNSASVYIFQISGVLVLAAAKSVLLSGGVNPDRVFWQVAGNVSLGATSHIKGQILCATDISLGAGALATGRLLAQTAVNLNSSTVSS